MNGGPPKVIMNKLNCMFYVYVLSSISHPDKNYVGFTENLKERLSAHNSGKSVFTAQFKLWFMTGFFGFHEKSKAVKFEKYLKTNAGKLFLKKRFL